MLFRNWIQKRCPLPKQQGNYVKKYRQNFTALLLGHTDIPVRSEIPLEIDNVDTRNTVKKYRKHIFDTLSIYCRSDGDVSKVGYFLDIASKSKETIQKLLRNPL